MFYMILEAEAQSSEPWTRRLRVLTTASAALMQVKKRSDSAIDEAISLP